MASTAVGGQVHLIGLLTTGQVDPSPLLSWRTLRGIMVGSRETFEAMNRMLSVHRIKPVIDRTCGFDGAVEAYDHLASGKHVGKIVIRFD